MWTEESGISLGVTTAAPSPSSTFTLVRRTGCPRPSLQPSSDRSGRGGKIWSSSSPNIFERRLSDSFMFTSISSSGNSPPKTCNARRSTSKDFVALLMHLRRRGFFKARSRARRIAFFLSF